MGKTRNAPEPVEDDAFEELEDIEEEVESDEAPAPKAKRGKAKAAASDKRTKAATNADAGTSEYNTAWLANHVNEVTGVDVDSRSLRMLLRKMAKNDELAREVGVDRGRYTFPKGPNDGTVKLVIRKVKSGELSAAKREGLDKVKNQTATKKTKVVEDQVAETPAPKRKARSKTSAPAKAAPSGGRRRRASSDA